MVGWRSIGGDCRIGRVGWDGLPGLEGTFGTIRDIGDGICCIGRDGTEGGSNG